MSVSWTDAGEEIGSLRAAGFWNPPAATAMEVLGLDEREVPHSRMLRWLLDPTGSHGLGLRMLGALLRRSGREDLAASLLPERIHVQRELVLKDSLEHADRRADIVVWVAGTPVVIEMKVRAKESTDQTRDLAGHFLALHDSPLFIYLTLDGSDADHHAFRPMRLKEVAFDLREALAVAPAPTGAAEGRRTAADYLETLGRLTHMDATSQAAARFWLRHGDDQAFRAAKAAAWSLLRELPDRTAQALAERCGTADGGLRIFIRLEEVQGKDKLREERIMLLAHQRWLDEQDEPRIGVGLAVREHRYDDDDNWTQRNMPYCGIWIRDPALRRPLVGRPRWDQPWGNWGVNWDYLPVTLSTGEMEQHPAEVYANRASARIWELWTEHSTNIDAVINATEAEPQESSEEALSGQCEESGQLGVSPQR